VRSEFREEIHQKRVWDWKRRPPKPNIDIARRKAAADCGCIRRIVLLKEGRLG